MINAPKFEGKSGEDIDEWWDHIEVILEEVPEYKEESATILLPTLGKRLGKMIVRKLKAQTQKWKIPDLIQHLLKTYGQKVEDTNYDYRKEWLDWRLDQKEMIGNSIAEFERLADRANRRMEDNQLIDQWLHAIPKFYRAGI